MRKLLLLLALPMVAQAVFAMLAPRRDPPRQAGNFLLLAQKKVTKEECLNTSHLGGSLRRHASTLRVLGVDSCARAAAVHLWPKRAHQMAGVRGLFWVTFSGPAEKVTRLPGRDPAGCWHSKYRPAGRQESKTLPTGLERREHPRLHAPNRLRHAVRRGHDLLVGIAQEDGAVLGHVLLHELQRSGVRVGVEHFVRQ